MKTIIIHLNIILFIVCFFKESSEKSVTLGLNEGDICKKGDELNSNNLCKSTENCESLKMMIADGIYPDLCSFDEQNPIFCCPPTIRRIKILNNSINEIPSIVNEKCQEYSKLMKKFKIEDTNLTAKLTEFTTESGFTKKYTYPFSMDCEADLKSSVTSIVIEKYQKVTKKSRYTKVISKNIPLAKPKEYPHMAIIGFGEKLEDSSWGCGGSLISERWILSAAHCEKLKGHNVIKMARWARLGDLNIILTTDDARPKDYRIVRHVIHPCFKPPSNYNDIALFQLEKNVEFSEYVMPICLNSNPSLEPQMQVATSWGKPSYESVSMSHDLLKVELNIVSGSVCNDSYGISNALLKYGILNDRMICATPLEGTIDVSAGDSGGPLQYKHNGSIIHTQYGLISFGTNFGDDPVVYTRVSKYISWIESIVWS